MKRIPTNEVIEGTRIRCYDLDDGVTFDRYSVLFIDEPWAAGTVTCLGMSEDPFAPYGFGQHCEADPRSKGLGKRIRFGDLPSGCQEAVLQDIADWRVEVDS